MELAESQISERGSERSTAISKEPSRTRMRSQAAGVAQFLAVVIQFGLIILVVNYWQLEGLRVGRLMQLALIGFVIHHLLPPRFRLPFFAMLSLASVITIVGQISPRVLLAAVNGRTSPHDFLYLLIPGLTLIGIGLGLLGLCHLSIRLGLRIALVVAAAGAGLAFVRVHSQWCPNPTGIWVILGSMFMTELGLERELQVGGKHAVLGSSEIPRNIIARGLRI
jgi:hypothetical protein